MKQIFINIPVKNVEESMDFYTRLGFTNKPLFSDDQQKCMVWNEYIYVMLLSKEKFKVYSKKNISAKSDCNAYFTLLVESLEKVNTIVDCGLKAGDREPIPMVDEGFMQIRCIEDLDGHNWHITYMDVTEFKKTK